MVAQPRGKDGLRSVRSNFIDGRNANVIEYFVIDYKQIACAVKSHVQRLVQSGGKNALLSVPAEFVNLAAASISSRDKQVLRERTGADQNNCSQTCCPAE